MSWAMPMVATRMITRGASNRRRMMARSTMAPTAMPTIRARANAAQYGKP